MRRRTTIPGSVAALAKSQGGVLSAAQLQHLSEGARRSLAKGWEPIAPGLYSTGGTEWHTAMWAGLLRGGDDAVVGGLAAAHLHGMVPDPPSTISVWVPPGLAKRDLRVGNTDVTYRRGDRTGILSPARTRLVQTLLDVARREDENTAVATFARALADKRSTPARLLAALDEARRLPHRRVLERLCGIEGTGIESVLEWLFSELVERPHGLPPMKRQLRLDQDSRLDGLYADQQLAVEVDGARFHDAHQDRDRDNRNIERHDVSTLRYGWHHVTRGACSTAQQLLGALRRRGWRGKGNRCTNCPRPARP